MTFIVYFKDGSKTIYTNRYIENNKHEIDIAWDDVYEKFPDAEYIESL